MNNKIYKFRIWEDDAKEFLYLDPAKDGFDSKWLEETPGNSINQYTNLNSKNDTEIYEGDIVKGQFRHPIGALWGVSGEVVWESGRLLVKKYNLFGLTDIEILGNVYENPKLLK